MSRHCIESRINYLSHCCDKILDKSNIRKERCIWAHREGTMCHGGEGSWGHTAPTFRKQREIPALQVVPPTSRVSLPSESPHGHARVSSPGDLKSSKVDKGDGPHQEFTKDQSYCPKDIKKGMSRTKSQITGLCLHCLPHECLPEITGHLLPKQCNQTLFQYRCS